MAPVVFELWGFVLYTYTLFGALGFLTLAVVAMRRGALLGLPAGPSRRSAGECNNRRVRARVGACAA